MHSKKLILFTSEFPYGTGEQFIETEIIILSKFFNEIDIYPLKISGHKRSLPANVKVVVPDLYRAYKRKDVFVNNFGLLFKIFAITIWKSKNRLDYIFDFKRLFNFILNRINDADWLEKSIGNIEDKNVVYYSYWFNTWGTILSIVKYRRKIDFFSRIHNGDFDKERKKEGYFPFREFELTQINQVYAISNFGLNYMKENYSNINFKISLMRLGVLDNGDNPYKAEKKYFHIVSCSFFHKIKRVHLIVDILSHIKNVEIIWTHFGNGKLETTIKEYASEKLGNNVKMDFKGLLQNSEIIEFYKTNPIDLFINTSELEGIPVSMMEAISFGVPIVGCKICGVPEIVNDMTGILLEKNFDASIAAKKITEYLLVENSQMIEKRKQIKDFWRNNFEGVKNYNLFSEKIIT
jgi:glycosyltransferase involved in cell wall biosynthesis